MHAKKGNVQQIRRLSLLVQLFLSFSQPCSLETCIQIRLSFLVSCLGNILRLWQCLFYISCTLLGHTLWIQVIPIYLSCTLLGPRSQGMAMPDLLFLYLAWPYPWNIGNVWFTFLLRVFALCMIYICVYVCVCVCVCVFTCGWSCALYDGLTWLGEQHFLDQRCF